MCVFTVGLIEHCSERPWDKSISVANVFHFQWLIASHICNQVAFSVKFSKRFPPKHPQLCSLSLPQSDPNTYTNENNLTATFSSQQSIYNSVVLNHINGAAVNAERCAVLCSDNRSSPYIRIERSDSRRKKQPGVSVRLSTWEIIPIRSNQLLLTGLISELEHNQ